jgi:hypothetical protein
MLIAEPHEYHQRLSEYLEAVEQETAERVRVDPLRFSHGERSALDALLQ